MTTIDALKAEAHQTATRPDGSVSSRRAAAEYVRLLRAAEGINPALIAETLDSLARRGASSVLADWRRRQRTPARTLRGTKVDAPHFAGVRRPGPDGAPEHVQMPLSGMSPDELREHRRKLEAQRNTLSREVRLVADLIDVMEAHGLTTAGDAIARLSERAS